MSLKLYKINTTLNHPDCMAGFKKNDDEILKKLQIKTAEKTASDAVGQQNTPQNEQFANQMMLQLLPKLIENPDSFSKQIELTDKAKK